MDDQDILKIEDLEDSITNFMKNEGESTSK